jgi:2,5-dihydroxypyridine 5,6-dioxygenase
MKQNFIELFKSAQKVMQYCKLQPGENTVIFTDSGKNPATVEAFYTAAVAAGGQATLISVEAKPRPLIEPAPPAVKAMAAADLVFDLASQPWLYTQATNTILTAGTRMLQVFVNEDTIMSRPPDEVIVRREQAAREILTRCETFRITSPYGTDIVMERGGRPVHTQGGFVDHPGDWDSLGVCLGAFAPLEDKANGKVALFGTMYLPPQHIFITEKPVVVDVQDGRIIDVQADHSEAKVFDEWLKSWDDPNSYIIAHTGFGIDHRAQLHPPDPGAWESYLAGVNIAFGGNNIPQLGGTTPCKSHLDVVLLDTDVYVNEEKVIEAGSFRAGLGFD